MVFRDHPQAERLKVLVDSLDYRERVLHVAQAFVGLCAVTDKQCSSVGQVVCSTLLIASRFIDARTPPVVLRSLTSIAQLEMRPSQVDEHRRFESGVLGFLRNCERVFPGSDRVNRILARTRDRHVMKGPCKVVPSACVLEHRTGTFRETPSLGAILR
jgi:hypothetical protein